MSGGKDSNLIPIKKEHKPRGRKPKAQILAETKELLKEEGYLEYFENGDLTEKQCIFLINYKRNPIRIGKVCEATGIARQTYLGYLDNNPTFLRLFESITESENEEVEYTIFEKATVDRDIRACELWAKAKLKHKGFGSEVVTNKIKIDGMNIIDMNENGEHLDDSFLIEKFKNQGK